MRSTAEKRVKSDKDRIRPLFSGKNSTRGDEYEQDKGPANIRKRAWTAGIGICFVAVILWTGIGSIRNSQKKIQEQQAKLEESQQANTEDILLPEEKTETQGNSGEGQTEETQEEAADQSGELQATQSERARTLSFSENSLIEWPASGSVLINYSMGQDHIFSYIRSVSV